MCQGRTSPGTSTRWAATSPSSGRRTRSSARPSRLPVAQRRRLRRVRVRASETPWRRSRATSLSNRQRPSPRPACRPAAQGATVTGVDGARKLDMIRSLGAADVIDFTQEDLTRGHQRYHLIFDVVGNHSFRKCRRSLTPTGPTCSSGTTGSETQPAGGWAACRAFSDWLPWRRSGNNFRPSTSRCPTRRTRWLTCEHTWKLVSSRRSSPRRSRWTRCHKPSATCRRGRHWARSSSPSDPKVSPGEVVRRPRQDESRPGRSQSDVCVGSRVWSTTASRSVRTASRSTSARSQALKSSRVRAAS